MSVSTIIPASSTPAATELWALSYLFTSDWNVPGVRVQSSFVTAINYPISASEQRWGLAGKPKRVVSATLNAFGKDSCNRLRSMLRRSQRSRFLLPLYIDQSRLTTTASATDTLSLDTTYRRLSVGYRVAIVKLSGETDNPVSFEVRTITAKTDTSLTLDSNVSLAFNVGDLVYPLIECQNSFGTSATVITDEVSTAVIEGVESSGATQLPGTETIGTIPSGFGQYGDYPILSIKEDFSTTPQIGTSAYGDFSTSGLGSYPTIYGDRASETFEIPITATSRYEAWRAIRFFESRGGRLHPFFVISPLTEFELLSLSGTTATVTAVGETSDWSMRPYIGFIAADGVFYVRAVAFASRAAGVDTLTLVSDIPGLSFSDIVRCSTAWLVRFDTDALEEGWITENVMQTSFKVREVLDEKSVTVANLDVSTSTDLTATLGEHCGSTASPTYYQAEDCDGELVDIWLLNTGQTLPFEFIYDEVPYRIPVDAEPDGDPGTVVDAGDITAGIACPQDDTEGFVWVQYEVDFTCPDGASNMRILQKHCAPAGSHIGGWVVSTLTFVDDDADEVRDPGETVLGGTMRYWKKHEACYNDPGASNEEENEALADPAVEDWPEYPTTEFIGEVCTNEPEPESECEECLWLDLTYRFGTDGANPPTTWTNWKTERVLLCAGVNGFEYGWLCGALDPVSGLYIKGCEIYADMLPLSGDNGSFSCRFNGNNTQGPTSSRASGGPLGDYSNIDGPDNLGHNYMQAHTISVSRVNQCVSCPNIETEGPATITMDGVLLTKIDDYYSGTSGDTTIDISCTQYQEGGHYRNWTKLVIVDDGINPAIWTSYFAMVKDTDGANPENAGPWIQKCYPIEEPEGL